MADKKLEALQDEIKLLKGEVKQSLATVRDYLLNMELPSSEITTILAAIGNEGEQRVTMKGSFDLPPDRAPKRADEDLTESITEETPEEPQEFSGDNSDMFGAEDSTGEPDSPLEEEEIISEESGGGGGGGGGAGDDFLSDDELMSGALPEDSPDYPVEEISDGYDDGKSMSDSESGTYEGEPMDYDSVAATDINSSIPKVNMMANLINWVSRAKNEIGYDQLPTFLEVYGVSGHLSPELKEVILHLAEITADKPEVSTNAGIWSEAMLSLHGILTGGESPLHPMIPSWSSEADIDDQITDDEIIDMDKPQESPVKLKLVFPNGDGKSKEFCIDLTPDEEGPGRKNGANN